MRYFHWLGHEHHAAKREELEREQCALDAERLAALHGLVIEEGDDG